MASITSVSQSGGETATVYFTHEKWGEVKLIIFPHGNIEVELPDGEDWAGPKFGWFRTGSYIGEAIEEAIENKAKWRPVTPCDHLDTWSHTMAFGPCQNKEDIFPEES